MKTLSLSLSIFSLAFTISCTKSPVDVSNGETTRIKDLGSGISYIESSYDRILTPNAPTGDVTKLIGGNLDFALIVFREIADQPRTEGKNICISPYSISTIFAMASVGARGETERQIQNAMWFPFMGARLHTAFNALDQTLFEKDNDKTVLNNINTMWCQKDYPFLPGFLHALAKQYGTGVHLADFRNHPEESRLAINTLISGQTNNRVNGLFPKGSIVDLTRLVLTNAVYFYSEWEYCFGDFTCEEPIFHLLNGKKVTVPMMSMSTIEDTTIKINYASGENWEAVELPYKGKKISMVIILPEYGSYKKVESTIENNNFARIIEDLSPVNATVTIPKFTIDGSVELKPVFDILGMHAPFDETADFFGIDGTTDLYISDVFHKAYITVDEKGTEATAASGISFMEKSGPKDFYANRPFLFLIKESCTNTILFIGRVISPE